MAENWDQFVVSDVKDKWDKFSEGAVGAKPSAVQQGPDLGNTIREGLIRPSLDVLPMAGGAAGSLIAGGATALTPGAQPLSPAGFIYGGAVGAATGEAAKQAGQWMLGDKLPPMTQRLWSIGQEGAMGALSGGPEAAMARATKGLPTLLDALQGSKINLNALGATREGIPLPASQVKPGGIAGSVQGALEYVPVLNYFTNRQYRQVVEGVNKMADTVQGKFASQTTASTKEQLKAMYEDALSELPDKISVPGIVKFIKEKQDVLTDTKSKFALSVKTFIDEAEANNGMVSKESLSNFKKDFRHINNATTKNQLNKSIYEDLAAYGEEIPNQWREVDRMFSENIRKGPVNNLLTNKMWMIDDAGLKKFAPDIYIKEYDKLLNANKVPGAMRDELDHMRDIAVLSRESASKAKGSPVSDWLNKILTVSALGGSAAGYLPGGWLAALGIGGGTLAARSATKPSGWIYKSLINELSPEASKSLKNLTMYFATREAIPQTVKGEE